MVRRIPAAGTVGALTTLVFSLVSVLQWRRLEVPSWDLGIFTQLAGDYAHLRAPIVDIKAPGYDLLGDHFHPILVALGPVFALFPTAIALLVVQNVLFGLSAWVVTRTAIRRLDLTQGVLVGAAYGASWGLQSAVVAQFHEIAFGVPLIALGLAAMVERRWTAAVLWLAPLVLVKEDLGLTVAVLGLVIARRGPTRLGLALAVWGIVSFVVTTKLLLPAMNLDGHYDYAGTVHLGPLLTDPPRLVWTLIDRHEKVDTLLLLAAAGGLIAIRSPLLLAAAPTLTWRLLADNPYYWGSAWHYSAILMPIVSIAALDGIDLARCSPRRWLRSYSAIAVAVMATAAVMLLPGRPLATLTERETYREAPRWAAAQRTIAAVPHGASVETDNALLAYLVPKRRVFWISNDHNPPPDYVVVDRINGGWTTTPNAAAVAQQRHPGTRYRVTLSDDGYQVAKRVADRSRSAPRTPSRGDERS